LRARAILLASEDVSNSEIAVELGITRPTLLDWRKRFVEEGVNALIEIRLGRGRKPEISADKIEAIVEATLPTKPQGSWGCT
jgi:transposase